MASNVSLNRPVLHDVNLLCVCCWLGRASNSLQDLEAVVRCFQKAGFTETTTSIRKKDDESYENNPSPLLQAEAESPIPSQVIDHEAIVNRIMKTGTMNL